MKVWIKTPLAAFLTAVLFVPVTATAQQDDDAPVKQKQEQKQEQWQGQEQVQVRVMRVEQGEDDEQEITVEVREAPASKYWIGVLCEPVESQLVKSQLGIDFGLVLEEVIEEGPSAAAGLKKLDIVTKVDGKPLDGLPMLGECISQSEGKSLELTVIRQGKPLQVTVTPAERPAKYQMASPQAMKDDPLAADEWKLLQEALRMRGYQRQEGENADVEDEDEDGHTSLFYFMPGIVLSGGEDFPKDLEVTVTKMGGEPTKVTVKRGEEKWEVDEKSLDKLPADIRPHVQRMLGSGQIRMGMAKPLPLESLPNWKQFKFDPQLNLKLEKKLDQLPGDAGDDIRQKLANQLGELQKKLEQARPALSSEVLDQIRRELRELREELERVRAERKDD